MRLKRGGNRFGWLLAVSLFGVGCGGRSDLGNETEAEPTAPPEECLFAEDCPTADQCQPSACIEGRCQTAPPIECDDGDECTADSCDSATGACLFRDLTFDLDADGYKGPLTGYAPGAPGACGTDCNDTSDQAFPGGRELCDGVDNDCNGVIDDGAEYRMLGDAPLKLAQAEDTRSGPAGLAFDGERWAVTLWGEQQQRQFRFLGISATGEIEVEKLLTNHNASSYGGPLLWTGSFYGTAWPDTRQGGTVVAYFNRLDRNGDKLGPDVRLLDTNAFARNPSLRYHGGQFIVFWDDLRDPFTALYTQRLSLEGELVGAEQRITPQGIHSEFASVDFATERVGIAVESIESTGIRSLYFMSSPHDFSSDPSLIAVDTNPGTHQVRFTGDRFTVVWSQQFDNLELLGEHVYGATFDEFGNPIGEKTQLTPGGGHARGGSLLPLGDRSLLFWSDDIEGNYEVYMKTIDNELNEISPAERLTVSQGYSLGARGMFGPDGQLGIIFEDNSDGAGHVYMLRLECAAALLD